MTIVLEHLADGSISDRNFQTLMKLVPDTGGQSVGIRFGVATCAWTASAYSAALVVSHGLGKTPVNIQLTPHSNPDMTFGPTARSATTFTVQGYFAPGIAITGSFPVDWVAIG